MAAASPAVRVWRDEAAYRPLLEAERGVFAWEWMRRDPGYRAAAAAALEVGRSGRRPGRVDTGAARWGLHAFEAPDLAAPEARPVWREDSHRTSLRLHAVQSLEDEASFDLGRLSELATRLGGEAGEAHWLLSDGLRGIRLDIVGAGPDSLSRLGCSLSYVIEREGALLTLRQLAALCRTGRFSPALHPPERRAHRWIAMLRAHDALAAGATQREIAVALLDAGAGAPRWRVEAPSLRSRVQRLVRSARAMAGGGYRSFLDDRGQDADLPGGVISSSGPT